MDSGVILVFLVAVGLPTILAIALHWTAKWCGLRVCSLWLLCVPAGYLVAVALTMADTRLVVTGTGESNLGVWVSSVLFAGPIEMLSNLTGVDWHVGGRLAQIRYWFLTAIAVLILCGLGLVLDGVSMAIASRTAAASRRRSVRTRRHHTTARGR